MSNLLENPQILSLITKLLCYLKIIIHQRRPDTHVLTTASISLTYLSDSNLLYSLWLYLRIYNTSYIMHLQYQTDISQYHNLPDAAISIHIRFSFEQVAFPQPSIRPATEIPTRLNLPTNVAFCSNQHSQFEWNPSQATVIAFLKTLSWYASNQLPLTKTEQWQKHILNLLPATSLPTQVPPPRTRNQCIQNGLVSTIKAFIMIIAVYSNTVQKTASALFAIVKSTNYPQWKHYKNQSRPRIARRKNARSRKQRGLPRKRSRLENKEPSMVSFHLFDMSLLWYCIKDDFLIVACLCVSDIVF